ncbi:MAG TPA: serine/threonine-protein kinase [Kofleriaceae bacterium]|jgi:WD40 repeat protein/tRNA A-37 threonylcarbamoyl transferase component Bud32
MAEPDEGLDAEDEELERDAEALIGRALGEFVIREPLSGGGFGLVFFAEQKGLAREAVIKVLRQAHLGDQTIVQRFLREARLATLLDHPYAAHTYGFGHEPDGVLWIAMELVRGTPLDTLLQLQGPIPLERFAPLLERICQVVQTAHERGIVHRDLKPANVMVLSRAGQLLPKLLDFGIARVIGEAEPAAPLPSAPPALTDSSHRLTGAHIAMGSPHYMAPEQWANASAADSRADIYALGIICFQALTGRVPFRAASRDQLAALHARAPVPPLGAGFPPALDAVLSRAMAKRAPDRFATALELAAAFQAASGLAGQGAPLPRLDPALRDAAVAGAPQPLARAIAALESARNAHQARDALWQAARVAVRLVAGIALAAQRHVVLTATDPELGEKLRLLRGRAPADEVWLDVARSLVRPFASLRDAHPVPELVGFLLGDASRPLDELLALRASAEASGGGEQQVRELLERGLALASAAFGGLDFLSDYPLVVAGTDSHLPGATVVLRAGGGAAAATGDVWMGGQAGARPRLPLSGPVSPGQAALVDRRGVVVVSLWPFIQAHEPSPGAGSALFFLDGRGRRGARLIALPDPFEIDDEEAWNLLGELLDESAISRPDTAAEEMCPYPGLSAFTAADAAVFVGRERETEAFVNRLRVQPLLAVVGPSGAGKSSFIQAGVIPALPAGWTAVVVRPGPSPLASLAARLTSIGIDAASLRADLADDPDALAALLAGRADTLVLVVDQVEELFTVCDDPAERALYAAALARAARAAEDPVRLVMTLRDDFLVRAEELPAWRSRLGQGMQILTTPDEPDLRRILTEPLRRTGYELDPELPDEMVTEVAGEPAALALLSFTASRLWELRDRRFRQIGRKAYRSLGGVGGALAQHAEDTLDAMPSEEQRLVREVFRHAVTAEGTRAILAPAELEAALGGGPHAQAVIEKLVAARLFVVSDAELGERIEVAHEALLEAWPRLVTWRQEDAAGARLRDLLRSAARQWDERERSSGLLWRGDALAEYRIWRGRHPGALTPTEEAFAAASLAEAARIRRIRRLLVGGAFLVLGTVAVALVIFGARADRARERAVASERAAQGSADKLALQLRSQYEGQGRRLVVGDDPLKGLAFLAEADKLGARGVAHDFVVAQGIRATEGELYTVHHDNMVGRVRFSPDGSRLLTIGYDNQARLWDPANGAPQAEMPHDAPVVRAAFSPDGQLVATGTIEAASGEAAVVLWSADGRLRQRMATRGGVQAVEFSPDGRLLVTGTATDEVIVWEVATGKPLARLAEGADETDAPLGAPCAFSPDSALLACGDRKGLVRVWQVGSRRLLAQLRGHTDRVQTVRFSRDGARLLSASRDHTAIVWRVGTWHRELTLRHADQVTAALFSPDDRRVLTASTDRTAILWDAATGVPERTLSGHLAAVAQAAFSPDGRFIATASEDATAILWDADTGERLARRLGHSGPVRDVVFSPDGERMATASLDGTATVWSAEPTRRVIRLVGHQGEIPSADIAPDGAHVATGGKDGMLRIWDAATGRELVAVRAHDDVILDLRFSPDGGRIATASIDHLVKVWSARDGSLVHTLRGHGDWARSLSWHPDGDRLASASEDGTVRIWSAASGTLVRSLRAHDGQAISVAAFSPDGSVLATTGDDSSTRLFDPGSGRQLARFDHPEARFSLVFDPTGERVLSVTRNNTVQIWRVKDGAIVTQLVGHVGGIQEVTWGRQGLVVTASADRTARVWDPVTGEMLAILTHSSEVVEPVMEPSGRYLLTTCADGTARLWELPAWDGDRPALERLLRCRVPFQIENELLAPRPRDSSSCPPPSAQ